MRGVGSARKMYVKKTNMFSTNDTMYLYMKNKQHQLINDSQTIKNLCAKASLLGVVGLDTEFMREKAYFAKLCLVQLSIQDEYFLIDIIALNNDDAYQCLAELISNPKVIKIIHSSSQDIEVLSQFFNIKPQAIFDTQIAAGFCGYDGQIGYANLVMSVCDVELDKSQTRTNWLQRPLSQQQLDYAVNDVVYLQTLYEKFVKELDHLQRHEWFVEECELIVQASIENQDPANAYRRMNGSHLPLKNQHLLMFLSRLREQNAQSSDKPRPWILKDADIYTIANALPENHQSLFSLGMSGGFVQRNAESIIQFVQNIEDKPTMLWPAVQPFTPEQKAQVKKCSIKLNEISENKGVSRNLIANRKDIESYVAGRGARFEHGWRSQLVGDELSRLLT